MHEDVAVKKSPITDKHQAIIKSKQAGEIIHTNPIKKEGSQMTSLTPESVQVDESPKEGGRRKFSGMFNPAPKGTFAYDQAMRKKKHDDIEKNQSKDGSGMTSAIDRLQKHMNKEETELHEDKMLPPIHKKVMSKAGNHIGTVYKYDKPNVLGYTHGASYHPHGGRGGASGVEWTHHNDPETAEKTIHRQHGLYKAAATKAVQKAEKHKASIPEETELDEMDQKFVDSLNKLAHRHKEGDRVTVDSKFFGKQKGKVVKVDNQSVHVQRDGKKFSEKYPHDAVMKEDTMDPQAAIAKVPDSDPSIVERKSGMSKSARMIKALYKKKGVVKEDMFDHEKEDKSVATYGKKPKFDKADKDDSIGENKPSAAAVMTGGTTLTGEKRDEIEIDPMMRNRPGQPDITKKDEKKKDDKKDGKKEEKK